MITNTIAVERLVKREEQKKRQEKKAKEDGQGKNDWSAGQHADQDEITMPDPGAWQPG